MRTTLIIHNKIFRLAKKAAVERGITLSKLVEEALQNMVLFSKKKKRSAFRLMWKTDKGRVLPGVNIADRDSLYEIMEGRS